MLFEKLKLTAKPYYLLGHSFGGFIAAEYALKYQQEIKHLILMSPVGMPHPPARLLVENLKANLDQNNYFQRRGFETANWIWNE